jgi:N-acyl-D-aspartate/D-glutamate deacylase
VLYSPHRRDGPSGHGKGGSSVTHDILIRNGTVVDGTGSPAFRADVAVQGDRVVEVGDLQGHAARRTIDADGRFVTPGFVDLHSHLDAQIGWDPTMSSSCWHGVTSVVMGNCGMTFAPVRPGQGDVLATAMESVEDIPASCILEGLPWDWEDFGGYLDALERLPRGLNAGGYVGDVAVRLYVAGDAACERDFVATESQLDEMRRLVSAALDAGALGYSLSRSLFHRVPDGRNVPGTWSSPEEFLHIGRALADAGRGVFESAPRYNFEHEPGDRVEEELAWMAELSIRTGRPFSFNLQQITALDDHYRRVCELAARANAAGARLRPQITPRSVGVLFSLDANSLLDGLASFAPVAGGTLEEKLARLRDPEHRATLLDEARRSPVEPYERMYPMDADAPATYAYGPGDSLAARARAAGVHPLELHMEELDRSDGRSIVNWPVMNTDEQAIADLIASPVTILGLADAGAHATQIMDASQPTWFLAHWVRDQGLLTLEEGVRRLTSDTADFIGYRDRGTLRPGAFADVNVIDLDALSLPVPRIVRDFPGGAPRYVQGATGIDHTIVNGVPFMEHGEHTGELAGRILRSTD